MKYALQAALLVFLCAPVCAGASRLYLSSDPAQVGAGDLVRVQVLIDADVPLNTFAGTLSYPTDLLEPVSVENGGSIAPLWLTQPAAQDGAIPFAGFTPGGFSGQNGLLFDVIFKASRAGDAQLSLTETQVLRNDGKGSAEPIAVGSLTVPIASTALGGYHPVADTQPPEPFVPIRGEDPQLFGGAPYVVFSTTDKLSGVKEYEIAESRFPRWLVPLHFKIAQSPAPLDDTYGTSDVYVRAIDMNGNVREEMLPRLHVLRPQETAWLALALLAAIAAIVLFLRT